MIFIGLKDNCLIIYEILLIQRFNNDFNFIFILFNTNTNIFEIFNSQIDSIGLLNPLICNIFYYDSFDTTLYNLIRAAKNHKRHESISAIVKIELHNFLMITLSYDSFHFFNIVIKKNISLHVFFFSYQLVFYLM